jgi:hypothetical protein
VALVAFAGNAVDPVSCGTRLLELDVPLIRDSDDALLAATGHCWTAGAYFDRRGAARFCARATTVPCTWRPTRPHL